MKRRVGEVWRGVGFVHGPRLRSPSQFSRFRLGRPNKEGVRLVFGKHKRTGKWLVQSKLTPVRAHRRKGKRVKAHKRKVKKRKNFGFKPSITREEKEEVLRQIRAAGKGLPPLEETSLEVRVSKNFGSGVLGELRKGKSFDEIQAGIRAREEKERAKRAGKGVLHKRIRVPMDQRRVEARESLEEQLFIARRSGDVEAVDYLEDQLKNFGGRPRVFSEKESTLRSRYVKERKGAEQRRKDYQLLRSEGIPVSHAVRARDWTMPHIKQFIKAYKEGGMQ